jgi:TolB protein
MSATGSGLRKVVSDAETPSWSPDGRKIAFLRGVAIFVINSDGSAPRRLQSGGEPSRVSWSPDGRLLLFDRVVKGNRDVYVIRPNGTGLKRLTTRAGDDDGAAWAPDGRRIAFSCEVKARSDLCTMKADGSALRHLTRDGQYNFGPAWSPDGRWIAFVRERSPDTFAELYVTDAEGKSRLRRITRDTLEIAPAWKPRQR